MKKKISSMCHSGMALLILQFYTGAIDKFPIEN